MMDMLSGKDKVVSCEQKRGCECGHAHKGISMITRMI